MGRGRKKIQNPETARRILAAAERAFAMHGLAGARTDEIARAAGVNKAMLYYYFQSKKSLHRAVVENLFNQASSLIQKETPANAGAREALLAFIDGYFKFRVANPNYARLMQHIMMESPKEFRHVARQYFRQGYQELTTTIRRGISRGEFHSIDAEHTVINIIAMIVFYFSGAPVHSVLLGQDALRPNAVAQHRRAVIALLERGLFRSSRRRL